MIWASKECCKNPMGGGKPRLEPKMFDKDVKDIVNKDGFLNSWII